MIEVLKSLIPNFSYIQEHEVKDAFGSIFGFHSTLITTDNHAYAGGTSYDLNEARLICAAEAIERAHFFKSLKSSVNNPRLLLNEYPTTCGFAAGFEKN